MKEAKAAVDAARAAVVSIRAAAMDEAAAMAAVTVVAERTGLTNTAKAK